MIGWWLGMQVDMSTTPKAFGNAKRLGAYAIANASQLAIFIGRSTLLVMPRFLLLSTLPR